MTSVPLVPLGDLLPNLRAILGGAPPASGVVVAGFIGREAISVDALAEVDVAADPSLVLHTFVRAVRTHVLDHVVLVDHGGTPGAIDLDAIVELLESPLVGLLEAPIGGLPEVSHAIRISGDLWWAVRCVPGCCDGSMHVVPQPTARSCPPSPAGTPESPRPGSSAMPSVGPSESTSQAAVRAAAHDVGRRLDWADVVQTWARLMGAGEQWAEADLGAVLTVFDDVVARDQLLWSIVPDLAGLELFPLPDAAPLRALAVKASHLERLLPAVPAAWRPEWLCFIAAAHWRDGAPARAATLADEAWAANRRLRLAQLLLAVTTDGIAYGNLSALDGPSGGAAP